MKPNRQQQVDIYYNFIGQFDLPLSEKEIAEARRKAERKAAEKVERKKNRQHESNVAHQQAEKEKKRYAEKGNHTFRQKVCKICGKPFWPSNGQEVLCSEECKAINRRQKQLAYYHRKQSGQKAGEAI